MVGGDRGISGARGNHCFYDDEFFSQWIDAKTENLTETQRCHAVTGQCDGMSLVGFYNGSQTLIIFTTTTMARMRFKK